MSCPLCEELRAAERGEQPWAIAKLDTGFVWLNPTQYFSGSTFFVSTTCVREPHDLEPESRQRHLMEMAAVTAAVARASGAEKMNIESLGNGVPHLHWWITPRRAEDPRPRGPIWEDLDFLRLLWTGEQRLQPEETTALRARVLSELRQEAVTIVEAYL